MTQHPGGSRGPETLIQQLEPLMIDHSQQFSLVLGSFLVCLLAPLGIHKCQHAVSA